MRRRNGKHFLIFVQFSGFQKPWRVGADGGEGPPVPIPNTAVKPTCAHDTWLEAAWENRQAPTSPTPDPPWIGCFLLFPVLGAAVCVEKPSETASGIRISSRKEIIYTLSKSSQSDY